MNCKSDQRSALAPKCLIREAGRWAFSRLSPLVIFVLFTASIATGQVPQNRKVLILTEVDFSNYLPNLLMQKIVDAVGETPSRHVEFYTENLELMSVSGGPSRKEARDWLARKYGRYRLDAIVAIGPDVVDFLSNEAQTLFLDVPIVICGASANQLGSPRLDPRFTGTWLKLEPERTLEMALQLFQDTRYVLVVGGSSAFDTVAMSLTQEALASFKPKVEIHYLANMELGGLLKQLQTLPDHSIILYTSFFQDSVGNKFLNATKALPMIAAASAGPDFGMSDTYIGHGIVGGYVMPFEKQAKITAQIVSGLLDGKKSRDLPIETLPSEYMFDWHELQVWHIPESRLPSGSVILFRETSPWERTRWIWTTAFVIIIALSSLVVYLQYNRTQLKLAKERQSQLSGMLIGAEEKERSRVASELHDDFSQRLALLALGLENAAETLPDSAGDVNRQLHELVNSASELGADLHTLSHRLHSTTLERLGLIPGVSAFCKEFQAQQGVHVEFTHNEVPQAVHADVALCLFRIVQEGLRNVQKHSGANIAQVGVYKEAGKLSVFVSDQGSGFDTRKLEKKEGLGILSMEQRAHLMGGHFQIRSEPGRGTRIDAWVPVEPHSRRGNHNAF